jgi:hypothetical protein
MSIDDSHLHVVQAGNLEALLSELRRVYPERLRILLCVDATGVVTVSLFKPSTRPQQSKVTLVGRRR